MEQLQYYGQHDDLISSIGTLKKYDKHMKEIIALMDYKSKFGSKHFDTPYRSGMDKKKLATYFREVGYTIHYRYLNEIDLKTNEYKNKHIIYTSSEDIGYLYKSYIEDIIYALELSGAKVIPEYKHLRANNNKVFMELYRDSLQLTENIKSVVFGSLKDIEMHLDTIEYPVVFKTSGGASGTGVSLVSSEKELLRKIKSESPRNYKMDAKDQLRALKHKGYIKESVYRKKFVLQQFIPDLVNDWKVYFFGEKLYIFKRPILSGRGIKASGGGYDNYYYGLEAEAPPGLFDFAFDIFQKLEVPHVSIDIAYDGTNFYLIEFQSLYFGTAGIPYSEGYFRKMKEGWRFIEQKLEVEKVFADSIIRYLSHQSDQVTSEAYQAEY
ncbi:hypothetical protein HN014_02980 [Aquimarina sp. TRL1]|uniref:hypothetical protein n=1 Tax=Aquimarina sp. (strain TRL1) TaxID=2736252 RepID=UPI00158C5381|nr:hypothetical protein [Aquimarina sp. TRL1]QKX03911.1 hypothetical protein HN014_02980 [Aquimarina sp. TRL1]